MSFTYDVTTDLGKVRMLITDRDSVNPIFQDEEISAFLSLEDNNVRLAAAQALETIAANEVLVLKVVKTLDLETDGSKSGKALLELAKSWREMEAASGSFAIAEMVVDQFSWRERIRKEALRSQS